MKDKSAPYSAAHEPLPVSGPSASPSWNILKKCLAFGGIAAVAMVVPAFIFTDVHGVISVLCGAAVVMVFFALSLFAAHVFGRSRPQAIMSIFFISYIVKVFGFSAVLFALAAPSWLNKPWFAGAAVASVLVWQATEVVIFSKQRLLLFDDSAPAVTAQEKPEANSDGEGVQ